MSYFLAFNSGSVISGNDILVYPVTGIHRFCVLGLLRTFRLDMAELTCCNKMISNKEYFQKCCLCVVSSTCILASRNQYRKALPESTEQELNPRK